MRVLLYNHSGCENRGCEAIVRSTSALLAQRGARTILTSGQAESDGGLRLPDVERVVAEQISPYSVSRLINSIGFRLGMPREHEVARRYLPVIRADGRRTSALPSAATPIAMGRRSISGSSTAGCTGRVSRLCFGDVR